MNHFRTFFDFSHDIMKNQEPNIKMLNTLQKTSDTGPSFADAASSCLTFSNPLMIACISSANNFNCICKIKNLQSIYIAIALPNTYRKLASSNSIFFRLKCKHPMGTLIHLYINLSICSKRKRQR